MSLVFPQFNINHITHPLSDHSYSLGGKDKTYIQLDSDSYFEIPNMVNQFNNSLLYQTKLNDYNINLSYQNLYAEINSDTVSALFKLGLKQQYHSYKLNISKRYYKGNVGIGYSINQADEFFHNYNFYLNRRIFRYFKLEYRYAFQTNPTQLDLNYEDFNYSAINNQNHKSKSLYESCAAAIIA